MTFLNIGPCWYIGFNHLDLCLYFEHIELSHSNSSVCSLVKKNIASGCQSYLVFLNSKIWWSLLSISMYIVHKGMKGSLPSYCCVSCYIYVWFLLFRPLWWLIVRKNPLKKNCLILAVTWQSIRSLEQSLSTVCWYPPLTRFSFSQKISPFVRFYFPMTL